MTANPEKRSLGKLWLPVVLGIGALAGVGLALLPAPTPPYPREEFLGRTLHILLSAMVVALLTALLVVYAKVYADTGARFALGLLLVLAFLLFQAVLVFPLLLGLVGLFYEGPFRVAPFSDTLGIVAYSVFLYLSLE